MGRPAAGSVRRRGNSWLASVPKHKGSKSRVEVSFRDKTAADRWVSAQLWRLERGLEAERPPKPPRLTNERPVQHAGTVTRPLNQVVTADVANGMTFERLARLWHAERYEEMEKAGAERSHELLRDIELHLIPTFKDLLTMDLFGGRALVKAWLRSKSGRDPEDFGDVLDADPSPKGKATVGGWLWALRKILEHGRVLGLALPEYATGDNIAPLAPLGKQKRRAPLLSLEQTRELAVHLHVIHQLVLWLLRLTGERISEGYGLLVESFIDDGDHGYLLIQAQGGRPFRVRDADGHFQVDRVEHGKTDAAFRLIALPDQLTQLIRHVVDAFHTDPHSGAVDYGATLVPTLRNGTWRQAAFRSALKVAVAAAELEDFDLETSLVPHDFRKLLSTDLVYAELDRILVLRTIGHRAGNDTLARHYILDPRHRDILRKAAEAVEQQLAAAGVTSLLVATTQRPQYGRGLDRQRIAYADAKLAELGWQVKPQELDGCVDVNEAARILGYAVTTTRRLMQQGVIPAVKTRTGWAAKLSDVELYAKELGARRTLVDIAADLGVDYHDAYRTLHRLGLAPTKDDRSRLLLVEEAAEHALASEYARLRALHTRSLSVSAAAAELGVAHSTINQWLTRGVLTADIERDASGTRYVTRNSVEAMRRRRGGRDLSRGVEVRSFQAVTGLSDADVAELTRDGSLRWATRARSRILALDSVITWVRAYRPRLLPECKRRGWV